jgi:hypothetical protein
MLFDLRNEKQRKDLTDFIAIKKIGTEELALYFYESN